MVPSETSYASRLATLKQKIQTLDEQIASEEKFLLDLKRPASLLASILSSALRSNTLYQASQARNRIAQFQLQRSQALIDRQEIERLIAQFPEHDSLLLESNVVSFQTWSISIQEQKLDAYERKLSIEERLEEQRMREEEAAIQKELEDIAVKQRELDKKKAKLAKRSKRSSH